MPVDRIDGPDLAVLPGLSWLTRHLPDLAGAASDGELRWVKRCGELALLHYYLRCWVDDATLPEPALRPHLDAWAGLLQRLCRDPTRPLTPAAGDERGIYRLQPYLWLRAAGHRIAGCEAATERLARGGARPDSIGLYHCLWKAGLVRRPNWPGAVARWLSIWGDDAQSWDRSAYRITHAVFYITDFGNDEPRAAPADRRRLVHIAESLTQRWTTREHWDLVGELLIALACLGCSETELYATATRLLGAARQPDGSVAGLRSTADAFRSGYHPTVVDVLRGAVVLRGRPATQRRER